MTILQSVLGRWPSDFECNLCDLIKSTCCQICQQTRDTATAQPLVSLENTLLSARETLGAVYVRTAVFWMTTKLTDETVRSDTSILIVFEGRATHVWHDSDPTWVFWSGLRLVSWSVPPTATPPAGVCLGFLFPWCCDAKCMN